MMFNSLKRIVFFTIIALLFLSNVTVSAQEDHTFYSKTFQSERWYRIYLPADYKSNPDKKYPVVYYFHGWSGRFKWDAYGITFDAKYREKHNMPERMEPPFVDEWRRYTQKHDLIIVAWDGYEPLYEPGTLEREGIKWGHCTPYDFLRAHEKNGKTRGLDYRQYFRELVAHIDSTYRTIADRAHRGITGLSMGGHMSYFISGQNKDIVSSTSAFCPADNFAMFGPENMQATIPVLEMWRSLKGIPVRLTATDGDWLYYNDMEMKRLWENVDLSHFEFHLAHFPDHWAGDTEQQLDYHMNYFSRNQAIPESWNYLMPGFLQFNLFGYKVDIKRNEAGLTLFNHIRKGFFEIISKRYISDGPIIENETQTIELQLQYSTAYHINAYNMSHGSFASPKYKNTSSGKILLDLNGGGSIVGICGGEMGNRPLLRLVKEYNRDYYYFESGKENNFDFKIVNVGDKTAHNVIINAFSKHPYLKFIEKIKKIPEIKSGEVVNLNGQFPFVIDKYNLDSSIGNAMFEIKIDGSVADTQKVVFFSTPKSPYIQDDDIIVIDGRTIENVPFFHQGPNKVGKETISGGKGNGNGILEKGEEAIIYIRLKKGLNENDTLTFHRTYLINPYNDPYLKVKKLNYEEKIRQAGATAYSSVLTLSNDVPVNHVLDLWFRVESLNNEVTPLSDAKIYARKYFYRKIKLKIEK